MGYDTRIPLDSETRDMLRGMKEGNQTYDELINELVDELDHLRFVTGEIDE